MKQVLKGFTSARKNTTIKTSLVTLIFRIFGVVTLFGFTIFLTNNYDPKIVGQYDFVRVLLIVLGSVILLGTDQSILYYSGKLSSEGVFYGIKHVYFKMIKVLIYSFGVYLALFSLFTTTLIYKNFTVEMKEMLFLTSSLLIFYAITYLNTEVLRAIHKIYLSELFRNTFKYLPVILGSVFLLFYGDKEWLILFFLYGFVFLAIISTLIIFWHFKKIQKTSKKFNVSSKEVVSKSYSMGISATGIFFLSSIDVIYLKYYHTLETVAYYSLAVKLMTILSMVIVAVNVNMSPKIAGLYVSKQISALQHALKRAALIIFWVNLTIGISIILLGKELLNFFGKDYQASYIPLLVLVSGQIICSLFGNVAVYLNMTNKQHIFKRLLLSAVLINVVLNAILIPKFEMIGAAISFISANIFWHLFSFIYVYKVDKVKLSFV